MLKMKIFSFNLLGNPLLGALLFGKGDGCYAKEKAQDLLKGHFHHPAQEQANIKVAELLLNNGADINQKDTDDGTTPYSQAVILGKLAQ